MNYFKISVSAVVTSPNWHNRKQNLE